MWGLGGCTCAGCLQQPIAVDLFEAVGPVQEGRPLLVLWHLERRPIFLNHHHQLSAVVCLLLLGLHDLAHGGALAPQDAGHTSAELLTTLTSPVLLAEGLSLLWFVVGAGRSHRVLLRHVGDRPDEMLAVDRVVARPQIRRERQTLGYGDH